MSFFNHLSIFVGYQHIPKESGLSCVISFQLIQNACYEID